MKKVNVVSLSLSFLVSNMVLCLIVLELFWLDRMSRNNRDCYIEISNVCADKISH